MQPSSMRACVSGAVIVEEELLDFPQNDLVSHSGTSVELLCSKFPSKLWFPSHPKNRPLSLSTQACCEVTSEMILITIVVPSLSHVSFRPLGLQHAKFLCPPVALEFAQICVY